MRTGARVSPSWPGGDFSRPDTLKQTDQPPISTNPLADGAGHTFLKERIQHSNRIKGLLFGQGGFFRRPPFALIPESRNHWLRTESGWWRSHSQAQLEATWSASADCRPSDTPCSRSIDPLCQGVGARPASPGYEPLGRDRRQSLVGLQTGDGRPLPPHLKAQIDRELDRLEMAIEQTRGDRRRVAACHRRGGHSDACASNADRAQRDRQRICDCALDRVPVSSLRQSQTGGCVNDDRCPCSQASRRPLEVCHLRSRH